MPVNMLQRVRCDTCRGRFQRIDMSVFEGICNECFARHYRLCVDCGEILGGSPSGRQAYFLNGDRSGARPFCHRCHYYRQPNSNHWDFTPFEVSIATYQRIGSKRKYGVEIETDSCTDYRALKGRTIFGCKADCSVRGLEFVSPVLYGDEGLAKIESFLAFAEEKDWSVNSDCGCHTHYDMRSDTEEELYRVTYAYAKSYPFWKYCVNDERRHSVYCHAPRYSPADVRRNFDRGERFANFGCYFDRYDYVNIGAWRTHKTFEVRLLEGSVDPETICNWITIHCRFIDYVKQLSFDDLDLLFSGQTRHRLAAMATIVDDTDGNTYLSDWLTDRVRNFLN